MLRIRHEALTFDDVLLRPGFSDVLPSEVSIQSQLTSTIPLNIPLVSAAMDTVTESRLAIAMAQAGGMGVIHRSMSIESQAREVRAVKKFESGVVRDPITIRADQTVGELNQLTNDHDISGVPVLANGRLTGIVTHRDIRFETRMDVPVSEVMTPRDRLVTAPEGTSLDAVTELLHRHKIEKVLLIRGEWELRGLVTVKDIEKSRRFPSACKDSLGRLRVGASIGTAADTDERTNALVDAGADVLVVDTAHGHSKRVLETVTWTKQEFPSLQVVAGNVATAEGARALVESGVDAVKVGIGPGSICTTRVVSGVGVPQLTAISDVVGELSNDKVPVVADGGIRYSGDVAKALCAGAQSVMVGSLLAGTEESPGEIELFQGRSYKAYRGMGSLGAMSKRHGSGDRYSQEGELDGKLVPEGVEGRVPFRGPIMPIIQQLMGGLRATMGYTGCHDLEEFRTKPEFVAVTSASMSEGHVHGVMITKEAPNYPVP